MFIIIQGLILLTFKSVSYILTFRQSLSKAIPNCAISLILDFRIIAKRLQGANIVLISVI